MSDLDLRRFFSRFLAANANRLHLAAHSHHYWPDVTAVAHMRAWEEAAAFSDHKWGPIFGGPWLRVQAGIAAILNLPDANTIALASNTHSFLLRILSALPHDRPVRVLASDSEFHSFTRQMSRLEEDGLASVERVPALPTETFGERFSTAARRGGHDLVFVSQVFFDNAGTCGDLNDIVEAVPDTQTLIVIDGYHGFMAIPTDLSKVAHRAFYVAGGYKYAMAGEGVCFLHCPNGYAPRPRDTGWFASFGTLTAPREGMVGYSGDGNRFLGATFDPTAIYRQAAVFDWLDAEKVTVSRLHDHVLSLQTLFLDEAERRGLDGFTRKTLISPQGERARGNILIWQREDAVAVADRLANHNIVVDARADRLRVGFGAYHVAGDVGPAVERLKAALA